MYFSIHCVKHVSSPLDSDDPGFGTHFSKQCSLSFCRPRSVKSVADKRDCGPAYFYQLSGVRDGGFLADLVHDGAFGVGGVGGEAEGVAARVHVGVRSGGRGGDCEEDGGSSLRRANLLRGSNPS